MLTYWVGNAAPVAMVQTVTITGATGAAEQTASASINGKTLAYTTVTGDTNNSIATNLAALLSATTATPEILELSFVAATNVITVTANVPGTPFAGVTGNGLSFSGTGGLTLTVATTQINVSPSDVINPQNWLRNGVASLPQGGDDVTLADGAVPLLWNLDLFPSGINSFTRWQSFTASVGLPENNPLGYYEWRKTYLQLGFPQGNASSSSGVPGTVLTVVLGLESPDGSGPSRERYDPGSRQITATVLNSGSPADDYAVRFLGTNTGNAYTVVNTSVGVGMLPADVANVASANVGAGGTFDCGLGVSFGGALNVNGGSSNLGCAPASVVAQQGGSVTVFVANTTFASVTARNGSVVTWGGGGTISTLVLETNSVLDKSGDWRPLAVTNATIDGTTCVINDPLGVITYTNPVTVNGGITSGPFASPAGRTFKLV